MTKDKIMELTDAQAWVKKQKANEKKMVFTNGCFDLLHLGHVDYLEKAAQLGDCLIVGLNADSSVKRLKGASRPVNPQYARARVLAALNFVDLVVIFHEDTPIRLIETLCPDVLVKGGDYSLLQIVGADFVQKNGGKVCTIPLVDGFSTTQTIEKMK